MVPYQSFLMFESDCILAPIRTAFDLQTIINKATTTNQMESLTLEEAKFLIGTEFQFFHWKSTVEFNRLSYDWDFSHLIFEFVKRK